MDLTARSRVLLDTSACIYYLDRPGGDRRRDVLVPLILAAESGAVELLVSPVTVCELLVQPLRRGDPRAEAAVRLFVTGLCRLVPADAVVADLAARLRARHRLATPDVFVCAAALVGEAQALVGNDARWKRLTEIDYVHVDDLVDGSGGDGSGGDGSGGD